ncbi:MAG: OB-fold domain-containing protein [Alphaproteobacteria bacterium]|uniref:Zn-ribbon domain-containing OB-fold protein n=1 Tax=Maricaulis alexandrii TaxID=2570354 RepID=UPI001109693F|nr:OB-fold domain-containing protein [Maricaulis alexandrii]MCR9267263.1 OB-fold domain-containing protein [Alphaproteobacteria bacterium]
MSDRKLPAPQPNAETETFWDAASNGVLKIKRCGDCNQAHYYPRAICPHCGSAKTGWIDTAGSGEIYSVSVMRRGEGAPFAVAYVTLDEGPAMLTNIVADDLDSLAIGQRVEVVFTPTEDGAPPVPMFTPRGG